MARRFGRNHAARAPPEIGCQDNQASIAKIRNIVAEVGYLLPGAGCGQSGTLLRVSPKLKGLLLQQPLPSSSSGALVLRSVRRVMGDQGIGRVGFATCRQRHGVTLVARVTRTRQRLTIIDMPPVAE
jgi:hypothetical protein